MGSGLIYAVIIVMWGAYFIPLWLRRHEERSEARSVDRFSHAMRTLSGRSAEARSEASASDVVLSPVAAGPTFSSEGAPRVGGHSSKAARSLALRRRRILAGLLVVNALMAVITPTTPLPWLLGILPAVATLGFLVHLRLQARRSRELSRSRNSVRRRTLARLRRFDSAERIFQARGALREERAVEADRRALAEDAERSVEAGWQPVPVPLPTYVTKPVAPRPARAVEQPGREELFDQAAAGSGSAASRAQGRAADQPEDHDSVLERRAVND